MVYFSYYGIEKYTFPQKKVILVLIFQIFSFLSRAFATMAKSYISQSYINGNRDCNTLKTLLSMQIILFYIHKILMINENLKN